MNLQWGGHNYLFLLYIIVFFYFSRLLIQIQNKVYLVLRIAYCVPFFYCAVHSRLGVGGVSSYLLFANRYPLTANCYTQYPPPNTLIYLLNLSSLPKPRRVAYLCGPTSFSLPKPIHIPQAVDTSLAFWVAAWGMCCVFMVPYLSYVKRFGGGDELDGYLKGKRMSYSYAKCKEVKRWYI